MHVFAASSLLGLAALGSLAACSDPPPPAPIQPVPAESAVVSRSTPITPGAVCAYGGTAVQIGHDQNGNGVLDDAEVEQTSNVCNADTPATLVRVDAEPAGTHCYSGGSAIKTGLDQNHDATLDDDEVTSVTYACDRTDLIVGDFTAAMWSDAAAVAALQQVKVITGTVTIATKGPVSLPNLVEVGGSITIAAGSQPDGIDLPALVQVGADLALDTPGVTGAITLTSLAHVGGDVRIGEPAVDDVELPALTDIGGSLVFSATGERAIALPELGSIGGSFSVRSMPVLASISCPALATVGVDVDLEDNTVLASLDLPALTRVPGTFRLESDVPTLTHLDLSALTSTGGDRFTGFDLLGTGLVELTLPAFAQTTGQIMIGGNVDLAAIHLPALTSAGGIYLYNNDLAETLSAPAMTRIADLSLWSTVSALELSPQLVISRVLTLEDTGLVSLPVLHLAPGAGIDLSSNAVLTDVSQLDVPTTLGGIAVMGDRVLATLPAFGPVTTVNGGVMIIDNHALTDLGLEHLTQVGGLLEVGGNDVLVDVDSLRSLTRVGGTLEVISNPVLQSIAGLAAVTEIDGDISLGNNPELPPDDVTAFLARFPR